MLNRGEKLPVDFRGRFIYYVGPVDPVREEVMGPAGPTTATRMDKFTRQMLAETGLLGMVGKAERGPAAIEAIREFGAVYLMAVGGAAYLVSKAIYGVAGAGVCGSGDGSDLRVRRARYAGDGGRGFEGNERAPDRSGGVAAADCGDSDTAVTGNRDQGSGIRPRRGGLRLTTCFGRERVDGIDT